jgi:soluble lytic murein transglycosylase-like protein
MADPIRTTQRGSAQFIESKFGLARLLFLLAGAFVVLASAPDVIRPWVEIEEAESAIAEVEASPVALPPAPRTRPALAQEPGQAARHPVLSDFLAKRYRVSRKAIEDFVSHAYTASQVTKIDPLLILAVMAVESGFNPIAESVMGAKGLMQVIPQYHPEKFVAQSGEVNVLDPATNILAGAKVLREYAARTGDDLVAALGLYGGIGPSQENVYATRVLSERERLEQIVKRTPASRFSASGN